MTIYTIGHSTRGIEDFVALLREFGIEAVADVRAFPASRRNPQFSREALERTLVGAGIEYAWFGRELGGYRKSSEGLGEASPNRGWRIEGFRIYSDYAGTEAFRTGLEALLALAARRRTVIMCAEKIHTKCHRRIISDHLAARGHDIRHIVDPGTESRHELTSFARVIDGRVEYPPAGSGSLF